MARLREGGRRHHRRVLRSRPTDREHDDPEALAKLRDFLRRHMPGLSEAAVVYSKTCTYSMTPDTDFVIDYLPNRANAMVAAGFSGHGFKFGILIGQDSRGPGHRAAQPAGT